VGDVITHSQYETPMVPVSELRVGMYVILTSWIDHPFLKSQFLIESKSQIKQIVESGYRNVRVDPSKSIVREMEDAGKQESIPERREMEPPPEWDPEDLVPPEFRIILADRNIEPRAKAAAIKKYSLAMMKMLHEDPKAENIQAVKSGVYDIVDVILDEEETANQLISMTEHDTYTYTHSVNVGMFSIMLAKRVLDLQEHDLRELGAGFFLHDLGKVRVDPAIINKRGRLTKDELDQIKKHPRFGYQILKSSRQLSEEVGHIVMQHHERVDGKGYPQGLARDEIHIYARICSIADVYDALTSKRSYKRSLNPFNALVVMRNEMLGHIQKDIFEHLVLMLHGSIRE
jgi:HD-GYP domain-containing protein (c-di-GMP phosphodiesterase class II)